MCPHPCPHPYATRMNMFVGILKDVPTLVIDYSLNGRQGTILYQSQGFSDITKTNPIPSNQWKGFKEASWKRNPLCCALQPPQVMAPTVHRMLVSSRRKVPFVTLAGLVTKGSQPKNKQLGGSTSLFCTHLQIVLHQIPFQLQSTLYKICLETPGTCLSLSSKRLRRIPPALASLPTTGATWPPPPRGHRPSAPR